MSKSVLIHYPPSRQYDPPGKPTWETHLGNPPGKPTWENNRPPEASLRHTGGPTAFAHERSGAEWATMLAKYSCEKTRALVVAERPYHALALAWGSDSTRGPEEAKRSSKEASDADRIRNLRAAGWSIGCWLPLARVSL
jgi:hypothetical protein